MNIELQLTIKENGQLNSESLNYGNLKELNLKINSLVDSNSSCFAEIYLDDELKVTFVYADSYVHLGIWKNCEEVFYIYNESEKNNEEYKDIGWNSFPSVNTTSDIKTSIEAIIIYLKNGQLSKSFNWMSDDEI